jgi:hemolysin III
MGDGFQISKKLERRMEDFDHFAIFLFIAGTYTPFILNVIDPPWNSILLTVIWTVGAAGIVYTHLRPKLPKWAQHRMVYTGIFVLMGWTLVIRLGEALNHLSASGAFLLVAGGLSYTIGAVIYALKRPNLIPGVFGFHELWHVMVLAGYGFHYFLILNFYRGH